MKRDNPNPHNINLMWSTSLNRWVNKLRYTQEKEKVRKQKKKRGKK